MSRPELCCCAVCNVVILPADTAVEVAGGWICSVCSDERDDAEPADAEALGDVICSMADAVKSEEWISGYRQGCGDAVAKQQDLCANAPKCPIKNGRIVMNEDPYMLKIIDEFGSYKKAPEVTP